ncbi:MAG TPA: TolC family protein [Thermoanaerobaculia bacterium]|nr:TolC family protein [Thermoanaerobaculia bacterium]
MRRLSAVLLLILASNTRAETSVTFEAALDRAMQTRGVDTAFNAGIARLQEPFGPMLPALRVEAAAQRAENIELANNGVLRFDALSLLINVDYPLFEGASRQRRLALARTSGQLFRRRALDEADEVFRETLDAFIDLYVAQRRMQLMEDGVRHAAVLRERARTMLELGQITSTTAANWEEQALATESQRLDYELARMDAEARLKQLTGNSSNETLLASIDLDSHPDAKESAAIQSVSLEQLVERDALVDRATLYAAQKQLVVEELQWQRRPRFLVSAFGGVASVPERFRSAADDAAYGIYGLRLSFTLPSVDAASAMRLAEAQLELEEAERMRTAAAAATRTRGNQMTLAMNAADRRVEILEKQIALAKQRQESVTRLVLSGVRTESDLFDAVLEVAKRESDLLAVRAERWRLEQEARRARMQKKAMIATATAGETPR